MAHPAHDWLAGAHAHVKAVYEKYLSEGRQAEVIQIPADQLYAILKAYMWAADALHQHEMEREERLNREALNAIAARTEANTGNLLGQSDPLFRSPSSGSTAATSPGSGSDKPS